MKKFVTFIIIIIIPLFLLSCDEEEGCVDHLKHSHFCLINESNHKIKIETYDVSRKTINYSEYITDSLIFSQAQINDTIPHPFREPVVKLIYDDTISVWFSNLQMESKYNVRSKYNYSIRTYGLFNETIVYTYTLTEADYQYALEHREENE